MIFFRQTRCFATWIACIVVLFAALAPSVSHALASAGKASSLWMEICSADSVKFAKQDSAIGSSSQENKSSIEFEHCPYCLPHGASVGLPPSSSFNLPVLTGSFPLPSLFYQSPRPLFIWAGAQSRAPPASS